MENLLNEIKKVYGIHFPHCLTSFSKGCLGNDTYYLSFFLATKTDDFTCGIAGNDCFHIMFCLEINDDNTFTLRNISKSVRVKPNLPYVYCSTIEGSFRKTQGNDDKIIKSLDKFFQKLFVSIHDEYKSDNFLEDDKELVCRLLTNKGLI